MSEHNPFAPVGTPVMSPPAAPGMVPPQGFAPPPMAGFAPPPAAAPPVQAYQSAGMALTELSFAPLPAEEVEAPVVPPPVGQSLVTNVLPSGGVARRLSMGGGRTPLIALILVLLLGAAGAAYSTGMFTKKAAEPAPIIHKKKPAVTAPVVSTPAVVAPVKPVAKPVVKPVVKPLVGKTLAVTKANSGTLGAPYSVLVPTGWISQLKVPFNQVRSDVIVRHAGAKQGLAITTVRLDKAETTVTAKDIADFKAGMLKSSPRTKALPGVVTATVAGIKASGFDASFTAAQGTVLTMRTVLFVHGGVGYVAIWGAPTADFTKSLATYNQLLASVKFAK